MNQCSWAHDAYPQYGVMPTCAWVLPDGMATGYPVGSNKYIFPPVSSCWPWGGIYTTGAA